MFTYKRHQGRGTIRGARNTTQEKKLQTVDQLSVDVLTVSTSSINHDLDSSDGNKEKSRDQEAEEHRKMALSVALPLSGLEPEHFHALGVRLLYEQGLRTLTGGRPNSPSTASESSGVCSMQPSSESTTAEGTPASSRPDTPNDEPAKRPDKDPLIRIQYKDRDILNLGANIREPFWQMRIPLMPRYDFKSFMENRSVYYRLGEYGLTEEYPTRPCTDCGFSEPSPYLF